MKKDKGQDFAARLKGLKAFGLGKDEMALTDRTIANRSKIKEEIIAKCKTAGPAIEKAFEYIEVVSSILKMTETLRRQEAQLEKVHQSISFNTFVYHIYQSSTDAALKQAYFTKSDSRQQDLQEGVRICDTAINTYQKIFDLVYSIFLKQRN